MNVLFVVNATSDLTTDMASTSIAVTTAREGHDVWLADLDALSLTNEGRVVALAHRVPAQVSGPGALDELLGTRLRVVLRDLDLVVLRTNPARDTRGWAHTALLALMTLVHDRGVRVVNDPVGLSKASDKLYLAHVPEHLRPRTLVTRDLEMVRGFVDEVGRCILKPLRGTRGTDVFLVEPGDPNLSQIVEVLSRAGHAMVQEFLPEAADGDVRVMVLDGELFEVEGEALRVRRRPPPKDFRSNVHAGGQAVPTDLTDEMREAVRAIGPKLVADGLSLVGLDLIGGKIIEINVFSPGGFADAERFYGKPFTRQFVARLVQPGS